MFGSSWSSLSYATNKNVEGVTGSKCSYHSCLGSYECPVDGCKVVANAALPRKRRIKHRQPDHTKGDGICPVHKGLLVHKPCHALWKKYSFPPDVKKPDGYTKIKHKGEHDHARPHEKLSDAARAAFEKQVQTNIDVIPTLGPFPGIMCIKELCT